MIIAHPTFEITKVLGFNIIVSYEYQGLPYKAVERFNTALYFLKIFDVVEKLMRML